MDKEDAKEYLQVSFKLAGLGIRYVIVYYLGHSAHMISKIYSNLINKSINKPKLFKFFGLRWACWIGRANYWFDKCEVLHEQCKEPLDTLEYIKKFYHLDM